MERRKQVVAVLLAMTILVAMLCSALFIAAEADHDCVGEDCPVCCQIHVCRDTLKSLSLAVYAAVFAAGFTYMLCMGVSACTDYAQSCTLVSLKVKLSN